MAKHALQPKAPIIVPVFFIGIVWAVATACADSDLFPPYISAPALTNYVSGGVFKHTYYISPIGNDATGDGSIGNPWLSFNGATSGGSGRPIGPGDIIYARGGTYPTHAPVQSNRGYYILERSGTASDYIIITKYPGETPTFTGAKGIPSFSVRGNYILIDGLTIADGGAFYFNGQVNGTANYVIVQNSTFGACSDPWGDQINGTCIGLKENTNHVIIRNNYFGTSSASHAVKNYTSTAIVSDVQIVHNRFHGITVSYGVISHKGAISNWEYAYNRFEDCSQGILFGTTYNQGAHTAVKIHHNAFDNVYTSILERLGSSTGDIRGVEFHDNIVLNAASGARDMLMLKCTENGCMDTGAQAMGEFYNNAFYDLADLIDPQTTGNFVNYPAYWNFNAYQSASIKATAENQNSLPASSWDESSVIAASHGITRIGAAGNGFYYISDTSPFKGSGRHGDTIGGFVWSGDTTPPSAPSGLIVQ